MRTRGPIQGSNPVAVNSCRVRMASAMPARMQSIHAGKNAPSTLIEGTRSSQPPRAKVAATAQTRTDLGRSIGKFIVHFEGARRRGKAILQIRIEQWEARCVQNVPLRIYMPVHWTASDCDGEG